MRLFFLHILGFLILIFMILLLYYILFVSSLSCNDVKLKHFGLPAPILIGDRTWGRP